MMRVGAFVAHAHRGRGRIQATPTVDTAIVRFRDGLDECPLAELTEIRTPEDVAFSTQWDSLLETVTHGLAAAIRSISETWGALSQARIDLLPHQLWVCRRVVERWPAHWLVADDVGLGKTIEAGLIMQALRARGRVRRLLVVCPASLVNQWVSRLRELFDIRLAPYAPEVDRGAADFWGTHDFVVASLQTIRLKHAERRERLLEAKAWDLLVVDEAHHLNCNEEDSTLGYRLVEEMGKRRLFTSVVFFTATPHRGKDYGFLALLHLLRPDVFDPKAPLDGQLARLGEVLIRNNKYTVTDLKGARLFQTSESHRVAFQYSDAESEFYGKLTEFILTGRAYAQGLGGRDARAVMLVLIALQKIASSSVAAIRRALRRRHDKLVGENDSPARTASASYDSAEAELDLDLAAQLEESLAESSGFRIASDEENAVAELIALSEKVVEETKVRVVLELLGADFAGEAVLIFTEYKATQSLLLSALIGKYGVDSATFINGDDLAKEVQQPDGTVRDLRVRREDAARRFNAGDVRFLVSTEAGGEGRDLHGSCHCLIHADLPWNPMRLHQRVGRLNRYGQTERVQVRLLFNPDTVEAQIWVKLDEKIQSVMRSLSSAMEEPEDLMTLVLGMTPPHWFRELYADAIRQERPRLSSWFDERAQTLGGESVLATVRALGGRAAKLNLSDVEAAVPRVDLPDLEPFLDASLWIENRSLQRTDGGLDFTTPESWRAKRQLDARYRSLVLDRNAGKGTNQARILGVGHRVIDAALDAAGELSACLASVPTHALAGPLAVFQVFDRVTTSDAALPRVVWGVCLNPPGDKLELLPDWKVLLLLNRLVSRNPDARKPSLSAVTGEVVVATIGRMEKDLLAQLPDLGVMFLKPEIHLIMGLWPSGGAVAHPTAG